MFTKRIVGLLIVGSFLAGCSGPGQKAVDDLCTGTKKPYQVNGIWYHPQEHYDYAETGVASWYGPGFHKRPKSCGHTFDMHELSAAHKTLPIPSVVRVKNLENGKELKLVVDDRGPFVSNRIIDLSKKAAIELGTHSKGLSRVSVEVIPHESEALATYLKQYGRYGRVPDGRTWSDIYYQEIAGQVPETRPAPQPAALPVVAPSSIPKGDKDALQRLIQDTDFSSVPVARIHPVVSKKPSRNTEKTAEEELADLLAHPIQEPASNILKSPSTSLRRRK